MEKFTKNNPEHIKVARAAFYASIGLTEAVSLLADYGISITYETLASVYHGLRLVEAPQVDKLRIFKEYLANEG